MRVLISNAHFYINNSFENGITAIYIEDGIITKLLKASDATPLFDESIDLEGNYVYPGFIDTHTHCFEGGLYANGVDLYTAKNIAEVLDMISNGLKQLEGDTLFCWRLDESALTEKRFPTVSELDSLGSSKNILIRRIDGHSCVLSSVARAKVPELADYPHEVCRGDANDRAVYWFHEHIDPQSVIAAYHRAAEIAIKGGFTSIHTMIGDGKQSISHFPLISNQRDKFAIEYICYPQSFNIDAALAAGATRIGGCILADGSIGSYTAALYEPYEGKETERGNLYYNDEYWENFITKAHRNNLQVAIHCLGDRAIDQINNVYLKLAKEDKKDLRHQLIHCELCSDEMIDRIKASGATPVMQPAFDRYWGGEDGFYVSRLGKSRSRLLNRFNSMTSRGILITGGSDWYITELDAIMGIYAAINHHTVAERLSPQDAINIYTQNAAWLSHDENRLGSIKIGYHADFSVTTRAIDNHLSLDNTQISHVIKKGKLVS